MPSREGYHFTDMGNQGWSIALYVCVLSLSTLQHVESLECLSCTKVQNSTQCGTMTCQQNGECFIHINGSTSPTLTMGCKQADQCDAPSLTQTLQPGIVGRDLPTATCQLCCASDLCNRDHTSCTEISQVSKPPCKDDPDYNCDMFGSMFNICSDKSHASSVCRKYCHLCDYRDGNWSLWSSWSACDVTCSNGHRTRSRTCTNPAPALGGTDCVGQHIDTTTCTLDKCPVHGGWAGWATWSGCSVTCGVGLMNRGRSCNSPIPGPNGHHCNGAASDFKICSLNGCVNGTWSSWGAWDSCTATCNGGVQSRERSCSNPAPSMNGKYCDGYKRETTSCNSKSCTDIVYFEAITPKNLFVNGTVVFTTTLSNEGYGYSTSTGKFTCSKPGLYTFSLNLETKKNLSGGVVTCYIRKNSSNLIAVNVHVYTLFSVAYKSVYVKLNAGDYVDVGHCNSDTFTYIYYDSTFKFAGALITPS